MNLVRIITILFILFTFSSVMQAQEPAGQRELLKQYISDLQKNPDDNALRERIIKLAQELKPALAVPEEAYEFAGRANHIIKTAKTPSDFAEAAEAYKKALLLAPWAADYYFNLGVALEKAGEFEKAISNFGLYLLAAPVAPDASAVRERIGGLKYEVEKVTAATKRERQKQKVFNEFKRLVQGNIYNMESCNIISYNTPLLGCNEAESHRENWRRNTYASPTLPKGKEKIYDGMPVEYKFHFTPDEKIVFCAAINFEDYSVYPCPKGRGDLIGTVEGIDFNSIRWEEWTQPDIKKHIWLRPKSYDWSVFIYSQDRPLNDKGYDPSERYHYYSFYKVK